MFFLSLLYLPAPVIYIIGPKSVMSFLDSIVMPKRRKYENRKIGSIHFDDLLFALQLSESFSK